MQVLIRVGVGAPAREGIPVLKVVQGAGASNENTASSSLLDEIVRGGARQMLAVALAAEVAGYVETFADDVDENGRRLVIRNGHHAEREGDHRRGRGAGAGAVPVRARCRCGRRGLTTSASTSRPGSGGGSPRRSCPVWSRKSPRVAEVLPLLYLHGLSSSDFGPALEQFLGSGAGLSPATIGRLTKDWQDEATAFTSAR